MTLKTIGNKDFNVIPEDSEFKYQSELTKKLDSTTSDFNQNTLNEIVLWKVNRYALFSDETILALNKINKNDTQINEEETKDILRLLLNTKGVRLAMASTILRFKNPYIYQIIDQRVFRVLYTKSTMPKGYTNIEKQIEVYLKYLKDLRAACDKHNITFQESDRILYNADKRINKDFKIKY